MLNDFQIKRAEALAKKHAAYTPDDESGDYYDVKRYEGYKDGYAACVADASVLVEALEKIADPRLRDHKEPDKYTEVGCMINMADEALKKWRGGT